MPVHLPPVEAAIHLRNQHGIKKEDVISVKVETYDLAVSGHDHTEVKGAYSAKMSTPYSTAVALAYGKAGLQEFEKNVLEDESIKTLSKKVQVVSDEELSNIFPGKQSAVLTIITSSGIYSERVDFPKGEPENPFTEEEFLERYESLMSYGGIEAEVYKNIYEMTRIIDTKVSNLEANYDDMVDQKLLFDALSKLGVDFFTGVPDSLLNDFCLYMVNNIPDGQHVMAANEGNAIGIAAGHYMATGNIPVVYMQNSGIGNATNPLLSLTHDCVYGIPMVLVIGWRGDPAVNDHAQHKKQGELTPVLMKDMDIPYAILDAEETVVDKFTWAVAKAKEISAPVALIAKKAILTEKVKKQVYSESKLMNREEAVSAVVDVLGSEAVYLGTTGRATREVHEQLKAHGVGEGHEFQNVGSMGHVSSVGLGIALACPELKVVVFDGDAAAVMHLGALATNCRYKAGNLVHIVLNNGVNESDGGQPSAGYVVNLTVVAEACGYRTPGHPVETKEELQRIVREQGCGEMPLFIDVHVRQGIRSDLPKLNIDHKAQKVALMETLKK